MLSIRKNPIKKSIKTSLNHHNKNNNLKIKLTQFSTKKINQKLTKNNSQIICTSSPNQLLFKSNFSTSTKNFLKSQNFNQKTFLLKNNNNNNNFTLNQLRNKGNWKLPEHSTSEAHPNFETTVYSLRTDTIKNLKAEGHEWKTKKRKPKKLYDPYSSEHLPVQRVRYRFWGYDEWIHVFPHRACLAAELIQGIKKGERRPVSLPGTRKFFSVKKSPFKYGYAQEHYDFKQAHYFFTIESTDKTLLKRFTNFVVNTAPASVGIKVTFETFDHKNKLLNEVPEWMQQNIQKYSGNQVKEQGSTFVPHRDTL